jgi:hypothetical protein
MTPLERLYIAAACDPRGFWSRVLGWGLLMLAAVVVFVNAAGCGTTWPAACPLVDGERACKGRVWREVLRSHPTKPRPACTVVYMLDGAPLPVTVSADDCGP